MMTDVELIDFRKYSGTTAFYSNPRFDAVLGRTDRVVLTAVINESTGTTPTVTVVAEDSSDGENWADVNTLIDAQSITTTPATLRGTVTYPHGRYLRFRVTLGGSGTLSATMTLRASLWRIVRDPIDAPDSPRVGCTQVFSREVDRCSMVDALAPGSDPQVNPAEVARRVRVRGR